MTNVIKEFLESDERKVEKLIAEYPVSIPTAEAAKFLGVARFVLEKRRRTEQRLFHSDGIFYSLVSALWRSRLNY